MASYAALVSLKHTINGLVNSTRISLLPSTRESLESAYNETTSLIRVLEGLNDSSTGKRKSKNERLVDGLEAQIRDAAHKLEDVLEFHEFMDSQQHEEVMRQEITSFGKAVKKMEKDYVHELSRDDDSGGDDDDAAAAAAATSVLSRIDFGVEEMVGHSSLFSQVKKSLLWRMRPDDLWYFAFLGREGIGRTMVAKITFDRIRKAKNQFLDCCAWVTVDPQHDFKEVLVRIIAQVDNLAALNYVLLISRYEVDQLCEYLYKLLKNRRYMIVLDDVYDMELVDCLRRNSFPDQSNGSIVFFTTTLNEDEVGVFHWVDGIDNLEDTTNYAEESMWSTIQSYFFNSEPISQELEVAAKKIIHNCGSSVVSFAKTLLYLSHCGATVEQWNEIAADEQNPIFMVADEISEIHQIKIESHNYKEEIARIISATLEFTDEEVMSMIYPRRYFSRMQIISFLGMAGIGKTTFVRKIFVDEQILSHFDHFVWITLGPEYQTEEIVKDILAQIYPHIHITRDEKLVRELCLQLSSKRCLIVLDDLCSKETLLHLKNLIPDIKGTILVTTRFAKAAEFETDDTTIEMQLLDKEESWCLLRQKVFAERLCSPELEKFGRQIAEKCDGLPLLILAVGDQLLKVEISEDYWNYVASSKQNSIFKDAHHHISEALLPSYQTLPQHLKPCFLYMGVFCEKYEVSISNLINMWVSEGFLDPILHQNEEDFVAECLSNLVSISLVMIKRNVFDFQIKTYRLHSIFWHLSNSQAVKNKFFHAMNSYDDCSSEVVRNQRRLCIRNSILLGMKYVQNSMASNTNAHSWLCVSSFHQYPISLNFDSRMLRVMNAITIRLYEFPIEVMRLVHLRYLGLTCNRHLPSSISNLRKLQYLIVKRYMNIKSCDNSSLLPVEIWDMEELKHLQIMGVCLPDHRGGGAGLLKLSTLLDVNVQSCRYEVLKWIPNLKRLGILIELAPNDESKSFRYLNNIHCLGKLETLKCVVVNPQIRCPGVTLPTPFSMFPADLKKLSLSGLGFPWKHMSIIGELKNLEVLKLRNYAFQGPNWEMNSRTTPFEKLKFLLVEDTNLVHWDTKSINQRMLERVCIKHCYKLQELPYSLWSGFQKRIEIVDCSPAITNKAKQMANIFVGRVHVRTTWSANTHQQ